MTQLVRASNQWASRPDDERYLSMAEMSTFFRSLRDSSRSLVRKSKEISISPDDGDENLTVLIDGESPPLAPTHWSFGQIASLADSPPNYLRKLPSPLAADCINYGLRFNRNVEDVGILASRGDLRAVTGPSYGRVWNADVVDALISRFGDGTGEDTDWKVPGIFGKEVPITKDNTTLYASDRDMFVFLADERNRIEIPNRRDGKAGSLSRGFFVWNSEVGKTTLGVGTFLFDYVCANRIVWGANTYGEIRLRHTSSGPRRFVEEVQPVLRAYSRSSAHPIKKAIKAAQEGRIDDVKEFLNKRFNKRMTSLIQLTHETEEGRPIETLWDAATAITAYARGISHSDSRVEMERQAGDLIAMA